MELKHSKKIKYNSLLLNIIILIKRMVYFQCFQHKNESEVFKQLLKVDNDSFKKYFKQKTRQNSQNDDEFHKIIRYLIRILEYDERKNIVIDDKKSFETFKNLKTNITYGIDQLRISFNQAFFQEKFENKRKNKKNKKESVFLEENTGKLIKSYSEFFFFF